MNRQFQFLAVLAFGSVFCFGASNAHAASFQVLHSFTGSTTDGGSPSGPLDTDGMKLYGASRTGGAFVFGGAVYSINGDGTGFSLIASLASNGATANGPEGSVTLLGSTLYGTSYYGGTGLFGGDGTVFAVNTDGSNMHDVHAFGDPEGTKPFTPLFRSGTKLYGAVPWGQSDSNFGTVFSVGPAGYQVLHKFKSAEGISPRDVSVIGTSVYGSNASKIFRMNTDGTGFQVLDAQPASGPLMAIGSTVFGIRSSESGANTLFSMNLDGSGEQTVHLFQGGAKDGKLPTGNLTFLDGYLYGVTGIGGAGNLGAVWRVHPDGTGFEIVHSFLGGVADGSTPLGGLTLIGSTLYGQTAAGGTSNKGTIFAITVPEPSSLVVGLFGLGALSIVCTKRRRPAHRRLQVA
jgi:uncharacterized repeat protein (TIGR03803 family)